MTVHINSVSSSAATKAVIVLVTALEAGSSNLYWCVRQPYIIIPHLQAPLQIDVSTRGGGKIGRFFTTSVATLEEVDYYVPSSQAPVQM